MAVIPRNTELDRLSRQLAGSVIGARKAGFSDQDISRVRDLQDYLNADLCGLYMLDESLRPNATLVSRPAEDFLKGYEKFRNRDPIFLHLLLRRRAVDGVSLLGFEAWVRHPLARFMKSWKLQYSMQGAIWHGGQIIGTLNFARKEKYGSFDADELDDLKTLCDMISTKLIRAHEPTQTTVPAPSKLHFSDVDKTDAASRILSGANGITLHTDILPGMIHPCLTLDNLEHGIAASINLLQAESLSSVEREVLENRTPVAKLSTFPVPGTDNFMTIVMRYSTEPANCVDTYLLEHLGTRTRAVLELVVRGYSNKLIACEMSISENTVKDHLRRLFNHFGVSSRTELTWLLHGYV